MCTPCGEMASHTGCAPSLCTLPPGIGSRAPHDPNRNRWLEHGGFFLKKMSLFTLLACLGVFSLLPPDGDETGFSRGRMCLLHYRAI